MEKQTVFIKKTADDFHIIGNLNTKRIKAYHDIANEYNVSISSIRDIFSLGITFAIANMEEIELPSEEDVFNKSTFYNDLESFEQGANYILDLLKQK